MPNKLRCAVIGVGNMGANHARVYFELPESRLVAVSDVNKKIGNAAAQKFSTHYYEDYLEMLEKEKIDLVSICVPTVLHYIVAQECANQKINILLEKPIAINLDYAEKILNLAQKQKIKFLVGHIERFNPAITKVKEIIDKGELGEVINIIARRVGGLPPQIRDANIAVDLAIHDIDIANYLLGANPQKIIVNKQKNHLEKREDSVEFFLKYKKASAFIQSNWITPIKIRKLNITGSDGYLEMDYISQSIKFYKSNYQKFKETTDVFADYVLKFSDPDQINIIPQKKEPLKEEILYIINAILKNTQINSSFALDALKIATY